MMPREVCHFTKLETALKILSTKKLRLGQLRFTNDPRESKERNDVVVYEAHDPISLDPNRDRIIAEVVKEADRIALEEWKVLCVTLHRPRRKVKNTWDEIYNERIRFGYSRPRMWAQYAEKHTGVCIVLDTHNLNANIHKELGDRCRIFQGRVQYDYRILSYEPIIIGNSMNKTQNLNLVEQLRLPYLHSYRNEFLTKHPDWRDETEFRWLVYSPDNNPEFVSIINTIKTILIGIDFPSSEASNLINLCKDSNVSIGRMRLVDGTLAATFGDPYQP
jgi:hypothetical protein